MATGIPYEELAVPTLKVMRLQSPDLEQVRMQTLFSYSSAGLSFLCLCVCVYASMQKASTLTFGPTSFLFGHDGLLPTLADSRVHGEQPCHGMCSGIA